MAIAFSPALNSDLHGISVRLATVRKLEVRECSSGDPGRNSLGKRQNGGRRPCRLQWMQERVEQVGLRGQRRLGVQSGAS